MWTFFKKSISRASDPGPKTNFLPHLPVAGDVIKFTGKNIFLPDMKLFVQKQAVVTTTMTKHIYNVFNFSFTYKKTTTKRFIDIYFLFCP